MKRQGARWRFLLDDDGHRTAFDTFAEGDAATAREPGVSESFQHAVIIITRGPRPAAANDFRSEQCLDVRLEDVFGRESDVTCADLPVA